MSHSARARRGALVRALPGVLLGLLANAGAAAQDPCEACGGAGAIACRVCDAALERKVVACSVGARCRACAGAGAIACTKCAAGPAAAADLASRRTVAATWLRELRGQLTAAGIPREPAACRTANFNLLFAPGPIDGCPAKDVHAQLHVYGERLEALRARALTVLGLTENDLASPDDARGARFTVALVRDDLDCARLTAHLAGLEAQGFGVVAPERRTVVLRHDPRATRGDDGLQRLLAHAVAHLVTGALRPIGSLDAAGHGWLDEGFAHWLETEQAGEVCETFCHLERVQPPRRYLGGRWRPGVRGLLETSELPPLGELIGRDAADLEPRHHALAFALVDYLLRPTAAPITPGPIEAQRALPGVVRAAKSGSPPADALRVATGLDVDALDQRLRAWVKETYPRR